jgi:hypothetical protein
MSSAFVQASGSEILNGGSSAAAIINSAVAGKVTPAQTYIAPAASTIISAAPAVETISAPAAAKLPLDQYQLNVDPNPTVIRKKPAEKVQYTQQISVKFCFFLQKENFFNLLKKIFLNSLNF